MVRRTIQWLTLASVDAELAAKQFGELRTQVPLLYALLGVNALALGYTHYGLAPTWLSAYVPAGLALIGAVRALAWLRFDPDAFGHAEILRILRRTVLLGSVLSVAYISWSLELTNYGGPTNART